MPSSPKLAFSHIGLYVYDLETMRDFYVRVLGYAETDRGIARGQPIVFLSQDPNEHHQIVLAQGRTGDPGEKVVNQISLRVDGLDDLRKLKSALDRETGISDVDPIDHGVAWSVYFRDPEGNRVELFTDSPWYVEQPRIEKLDLTLSDAEIAEATHEAIKDHPTFRPIEDWKAEFADKVRG